MATGLAFALGGGIGVLVRTFFDANPCPPRNLRVTRTVVIERGGLTFMDLLQEVIRAGDQDYVLVVHGFVRGEGLVLNLGPGGAQCTGQHVQTLMDIESGKTPTTANRGALSLNDRRVDELIGLMRRVRAMRLRFVEWRSCDLGKSPVILREFQQLFDGRRMGAPKMENIFGSSTINILPFARIPQRFDQQFVRYPYPDKWNPTVINFLRLDPDTRWPVEGALFAENRLAVEDWIQTY